MKTITERKLCDGNYNRDTIKTTMGTKMVKLVPMFHLEIGSLVIKRPR